MTKKILTSVLLLLIVLSLYASGVSPERAAKVGLNFWKSKAAAMKGIDIEQARIVKTYTVSEHGIPSYYVFDVAPAGFVIVTADDAVLPILAYSFEGFYVENDQPDCFKSWMDNYKLEITDAQSRQLTADDRIASAWQYYDNIDTKEPAKAGEKGVSPLVTTKWDQGSGYNYMCPLHPAGPGGRCYAGCVATAMAQIMKFWNYPEHGVGTHSYYHAHYGTITVDFSAATYGWDTMTNTLNNNSKKAISTLIYHCGVGVDMDYSPLGSGSLTSLAKDAFKNYFHYRLSIKLISKTDYDWRGWRDVIMDNLDDGKPVMYSGAGSGGGHAWVCDGYQDTSHFHMNWGWSGYNNGYFALDHLTTGGGDFSSGQQAVVNIIPYEAPYCVEHKILKDRIRSFGDGSEYSYYWNNTGCDWLIQPTNATSIVLAFTQFKTEAGKDFVSIYDGNSTSAPLLGTYSGHMMPPVLTSSGGSMFIVFTSDGTNQDLGWEAGYIAAITGTDEYDLSSHMVIYPNPAEDHATLRYDQPVPENVSVTIADITGQLVRSYQLTKGAHEQRLDLSGIRRGVYVLSISGERSHYCSKIVLQ